MIGVRWVSDLYFNEVKQMSLRKCMETPAKHIDRQTSPVPKAYATL